MTVNANAGEYKSTVGLDSLYIAEVTADSATAYTADTPEYFAPAAEASLATSSKMETQYADDQPYDVMVAEGETTISLTVTGIPSEMYAKVLGKTFDAATGQVWDNGGTPPDMALGFRAKKSNGSYRYYWFLKGKFAPPGFETATQRDTPDPKTTKITYTAIKTTYPFDIGSTNETVLKVMGDTDTTNFSATGWFSQVITPVASTPSALALSSSDPADGATGVVVSVSISLVFNNALRDNAIYNVVLSKADGTLVACTNSLDAAKTTMTVNPDANMSASTVHILAIGVEDIYGQDLQAVVNFTTA